MTNKEVLAEVRSICDDAERSQNTLSDTNGGFEKWQAEQKSIEDRITKLDASVGSGLVPGRLLRFGVADGYALYIVTKVLKSVVHVDHAALCDGYSFMGAYNDKKGNLCLPRQVCEAEIGWRNAIERR